MRLTQCDEVVHALSPHRSDQSSAKPFCQGEAGAVGLSRMPMARNRRVTTVPYTRSQSRIRYFGCSFQGNASVI